MGSPRGRCPRAPPQNRLLVPLRCGPLQTLAGGSDQAGLARNGTYSGRRRLYHRGEPQFACRSLRLRALPVQQRTRAAIPGEERSFQGGIRRRRDARHRADPRLPREHGRAERLPGRDRGRGARRVRRVLPRGHPDPRPRRLAHDRQDRRRAGRPPDQVPGDPRRPVGRQRTAAAVRQEAQPPSAQDPPRAGRPARGPHAVLRPRDDPGTPQGGDGGHHGGSDRPAGGDPRREGARDALRPAPRADRAASPHPGGERGGVRCAGPCGVRCRDRRRDRRRGVRTRADQPRAERSRADHSGADQSRGENSK